MTRFLDGEASPEDIAAIVVAQDTDLDLRRRLDRLRVLGDMAAMASAPVLASAPSVPADLVQGRSKRSPWPVRLGLAASLVLGVLIGAFGGARQGPDDWMAYVAAYQALYTEETLSSLPAAQTVTDAGLAQALGRDLPPVDVEGLSFRRAQLLGYEGQPLVQMAFLTEGGAPVALCIIALPRQDDSPLRMTQLEGMQAAHWTDGGYGYLLIGGDEQAVIRTAALDVLDDL
ncbi:hypothetical protein [Jannaschia sp. AI_61]|uniref:hypothetical protein n=1 Tax=Jannaschia sp. AI_61 TaxID=2829796 RepID=UPI001C7D79ED|nr:hypothetical protein [Jannaschia sp. AI_61]